MPNSRSGVHRPSRTSDIRLRRDSPRPSARGDTLQSGVTTQVDRLKVFSLQPEHLSSYDFSRRYMEELPCRPLNKPQRPKPLNANM
jgi:hypothetical protein